MVALETQNAGLAQQVINNDLIVHRCRGFQDHHEVTGNPYTPNTGATPVTHQLLPTLRQGQTMKTIRHTALNGLAALVVIVLVAQPITARAEETPLPASAPESLLRKMSEELKNAGSFRFHAEINFDDVLISGQKLQYAGAADVTVRRPDGISIDYRDDLSTKRFWYDGKTGTLLDVAHDVYSKADLPGNIDAAVDRLQERYELALPLADLISSDLFELLEDRALAWGYIGVHDVEGTPTHHVALTGENADLQVWIQKNGKPLPLKLVVTYKNLPMAPQYQAVLMDWKLGASVSDKNFTPTLPKNARQVEFLVMEGRK